jgi:hypothetical protein
MTYVLTSIVGYILLFRYAFARVTLTKWRST